MLLKHFIQSFIKLLKLFVDLVGTLKNPFFGVIFVRFLITEGRITLRELIRRLGLHRQVQLLNFGLGGSQQLLDRVVVGSHNA